VSCCVQESHVPSSASTIETSRIGSYRNDPYVQPSACKRMCILPHLAVRLSPGLLAPNNTVITTLHGAWDAQIPLALSFLVSNAATPRAKPARVWVSVNSNCSSPGWYDTSRCTAYTSTWCVCYGASLQGSNVCPCRWLRVAADTSILGAHASAVGEYYVLDSVFHAGKSVYARRDAGYLIFYLGEDELVEGRHGSIPGAGWVLVKGDVCCSAPAPAVVLAAGDSAGDTPDGVLQWYAGQQLAAAVSVVGVMMFEQSMRAVRVRATRPLRFIAYMMHILV
jgi:hypothetical protein